MTNLDNFISRYNHWAEDDSISENIRKEHRQLAEWLKELKQLRERTRWIPVSSGRLPNFNDIVLASTDSDYPELKVIMTVYGAEEFWFNGKIKAWMSSPEPYKETESEDAE